MAAELAYLEFGDLIDSMVEEGKFTSDESRTLARLGLANYFAAAAVLPYRQFHDVAENFRYDVERLSAFYSVSYETDRAPALDTATAVDARRAVLVHPRRPRRKHVKTPVGHRFSLLLQRRHLPVVERLRDVRQPRQDPGADRPDARRPQLHVGGPHRGAPRRPVWSGRARPSRSGWVANCATPTGWSTRRDSTCPAGDIATPIGAGCRVCERDNCPQRAFPASGRALDLDEHRSTVSPYLVRQA